MKIIWTDKRIMVYFGPKINFYFHYCRDRSTSKFPKVKCNPTNKKLWLNWEHGNTFQQVHD